jgi:predicted 3-demethylubiquinone-9 3-methyltransferase (glyoxalase superfamily)
MPDVHPCLWFDTEAAEAAAFYVSVFPRSKVLRTTRYGPAAAKVSGRPEGSVLAVEFELDGKRLMALNGGPVFRLSEAMSLCVPCKDQAEVDRYWKALVEGGEESQCGWLKDRFGLSWQVFPERLLGMHADPDPAKRERVMAAMLTMRKIDVAAIEKAYAGR